MTEEDRAFLELVAVVTKDLMTDEDRAFLELVAVVTKDLIDHGYEPADDGENDTTVDEYHVLFAHCGDSEDTPVLFVCRHSEKRTVLITACNFELKDILINSFEDWMRCSELMTEERGLPLSLRPRRRALRSRASPTVRTTS